MCVCVRACVCMMVCQAIPPLSLDPSAGNNAVESALGKFVAATARPFITAAYPPDGQEAEVSSYCRRWM